MGKDLTNSHLDRQNILNNCIAVNEIQKSLNINGVMFDDSIRFTIGQVAEIFNVDQRTIERYLEAYHNELSTNGYEVIQGDKLKGFIILLRKTNFVTDINVGNKTRKLGIFNFRSLLNLAMLLKESKIASDLRLLILDIIIDLINQKTNGKTKYINQRDNDFLINYFKEEDYHKKFTDALQNFVDMGKFKYPMYTNKIYESIFKEKANEYRKLLRLSRKDKIKSTLYSEILLVISAFENGFASLLESESKKSNRQLTYWEVEEIYQSIENQPLLKPILDDARSKMASRDLALRDALHAKLEEYLKPLTEEEYDKFIGNKSIDLIDQLESAKDVLKRLKER